MTWDGTVSREDEQEESAGREEVLEARIDRLKVLLRRCADLITKMDDTLECEFGSSDREVMDLLDDIKLATGGQ